LDNGFVKTYRRLNETGLFLKPKAAGVYLFLSTRAAWKEKRMAGRNGIVNLEPGEVFMPRSKMRIELNLSEQELKTCIAFLEGIEIITTRPTKAGNVYKVVDMGEIQTEPKRPTKVLTKGQPRSNQPNIKKKEKKEEKREVARGKHKHQDSFWKHIQETSKVAGIPALWPKFKWFRDALTDCLEGMGLETACRHWDNFLKDPWISNKSVQVFMKDPAKWATVRKKFDTVESLGQTPTGDEIKCHHEMDWNSPRVQEKGFGNFFGPCVHCGTNIHRTRAGV